MRNTDPSHSDDGDMSSEQDRQAEALLRAARSSPGADPVLRALHDLSVLGRAAAPTPGPELAALLDGTTPLPAPAVAPARRRRLRSLSVLSTVTVLVGGATTAATAAQALPDPVQRAAATVLNSVTPFHFPTPQQEPADPAPTPSGTPTQTPKATPPTTAPRHTLPAAPPPAHVPAPAPTAELEDAPEPASAPTDDDRPTARPAAPTAEPTEDAEPEDLPESSDSDG